MIATTKEAHMSRHAWLMGIVVCLVAACGPSVNVERERNTLLELDREWSQSTKDLDKFLTYYAPDASVYPPGMPVATGPGAIRDAFTKMTSMPGFSLQFAPTKADVSAAGDVGYTTGTYEMTAGDAAGNPTTEKGKYVTVWKKQPGGQWKVAEDIFNADAAHEPPASQHVLLAASGLTWGDAPPKLPPGAKMAVISGDPGKAGPFAVRLQFPAGYKVAAHWHPTDEHVTVLSGAMALGMGEKFDQAALQDLPQNGYALLPAGMRHFAMAKTATTIQIHAMGPFVLNYVDPADDPSSQQTK